MAETAFETPPQKQDEKNIKYWTINDFDLVTMVISTGSCFYSLLLCSVITRSFDGLTFQIQLLFHKIIFYKIQEMINPTSRLGSERKPFTQSYHVQIAGCNQTILGCSSFNRQKGLNIWNNPSCILESDYKLSALRLPKLGSVWRSLVFFVWFCLQLI